MSKIIIRNPTTNAILKEIEEDNKEKIHNKFLLAKQAFEEFKHTGLSYRLQIIKSFQSKLSEKKDFLAKILSQEMGKPFTQALSEITALEVRINFFLENVPLEMATKEIKLSNTSVNEKISYEPLGIIANISAWNYPYFVGGNVFIPALLCGNCVLYKASEYTLLTGLEIAKIFAETELLPNSFQIIIGGSNAGTDLLNEDIDGVFFTGSYQTGKKIAQKVANKMIPLQLELGGKCPAYIHKDVLISHAATSTAEGAFYNNGQSCCAVERIYVHKEIYDNFLKEFVKSVQSFELGDPLQPNIFLGPLSRKKQISYLNDQLIDALDKGAKLIFGLPPNTKKESARGYFFSPRVLSGVNHKMKLMREETFGPIIGIQKVDDEKEALEKMQDTEYGLTASVYTKDGAIAKAILEELKTGTVYWNVSDRISPHLPWSGRKHSGIGTTLSLEGIRVFCKSKAWHCLPNPP